MMKILNNCIFNRLNNIFSLFFLLYQIFFYRHWPFTGQQGREVTFTHPLYHLHTLTNIHLYLQLCMWLSSISNRNAFVYQTATRWDLPPYWITIWLIDWWFNVRLFTWWFDFRLFVTAIWHGKPVDLNWHPLSPLYYKRSKWKFQPLLTIFCLFNNYLEK